jgi:hypothetical protein
MHTTVTIGLTSSSVFLGRLAPGPEVPVEAAVLADRIHGSPEVRLVAGLKIHVAAVGGDGAEELWVSHAPDQGRIAAAGLAVQATVIR